MTSREKILGRIREALSIVAPRPGHNEVSSTVKRGEGASVRDWLPRVGEGYSERLALFQQHSSDLKTDLRVVPSVGDFEAELRRIQEAEGWKKIGAHGGTLVKRSIGGMNLPVCWTDGGYAAEELEKCDAGITECDALVAQTGSVLITSRSAGGRALSVLPPHHVVLARADQLLADLPDAFALIKQRYSAAYPSFISFVTGPSRTGDIERILVLGAHGPKKLTILLAGEA